MARPQQKRGKQPFKGKENSGSRNENKFDFKDAVIDASKFLNKGGNRNDGDDDNDDFEFDDEELDSDGALGSGDDLDDYMAKKSTNKQNLNEFGEEEDGWESVDEGELLTLSEMWDRDDKDIKEFNSKKANKSKDQDIVFDDANDDDDEDDESDEESGSEDESSDEDDDDEDPFDEMNLSDDGTSQLDSVLKSLKSKTKESREKKLLINDKLNENEFLLPNQGDSLTFDDMLDDLNDDDEDGDEPDANEELIRDIAKKNKKYNELIETGELDEDDKIALNSNENSAFAIPLPVNIQKRHERRAAYEIQKEQVNRWRDIIAQNRDKEVLKFIPAKVELDKNSAFKTDSDVAINDFESKLDSIINESNLESKKTEDLFENIETAKLSKSEMLKRTNELRLMRELMYRGMKDSKRLKKIKSKAYRRQLRKDKLKQESLISQANRQEGIEDSEDEDDDVYQRAKERMTLKHKNTSAWAKKMIKSGMSKDKSNRDELEEMMKQNDMLRLKQLGKKRGDESSEDERNLSDLERDVENDDEVDHEKLSKVGKGVLAMDFMKNAQERERLIKLKEIEDLRRHKNNEYDDRDEFGNDEASGANVIINSGRRVYTPSALIAAEESRKLDEQLLEELDEEDSRLLKNRLSVKERDNIKVVTSKKRRYETNDDVVVEEESNPWLNENDSDDVDEDDEDKQGKRSSKIKLIDSSSSKMDKSEAKIAKNLSKRKALERNDVEITTVKIENKETLKIIDPKKESKKEVKKTAASRSDDEYESEGDDEDDNRMFKQTDLIKEAFAGDDVLVEEFEREKREIEEDEGDKEINLSVPGWGSWAGDEEGEDNGWGVPKSKKRKVIKTVQGVVSKDNRLDKDKKKVIINERINKKATKYQADKVPYPYKTWEEYERSLRVPMGKEWTTTQTHQRLTIPKVITKFGSVIDPLKAPFSE